MKTTIAFALLILLSFHTFSQSLNSLEPSAKRKVDPLLQQSLLSKERSPAEAVTAIEYHAAGTRAAKEMGDMVGVLIESSTDITQYVRSMGGTVGSRHGNIYTVLLPTSAVGGVARQSSVRFIEASRPLFSSLDLSVAKTGADVLHSLADTTKRLTGKGVIIGFTDTGINTDHPNFKTPDGRTRILYVWDQYSIGTPPVGFTYGVERDSAAINAHLWSMYDEGAHGTHVAGIAAGNGLPAKTFVGMAPEADIITVSNRGDDLFNRGLTTVGTLDGYDYIRGKANALGKRFVINTSQGTNLGPHDGTSLFEKAIDADVAAGGIIALAAGNEATSNRHASTVVMTSAPQEVQCSVTGYGYTIPMDVWYGGNDRMVLRIKESDDPSYVTLFPPVDSTIVYAFDWVIVSVTTKIGSVLNGDNEIYITFRAFSSVMMQMEFSAAPGNNLPDGGKVDLWWERNYPVTFVSHVDPAVTFGIPAGADSAITVASYNNRSGYGPVDDISTFSGVGPRRDGILKPDISAPGGMVMSSVPGGYDMFSGTSMSSPHVAGAVALLLQQDNTLTSYQVKQKLLASATSDVFTGPVPNPTWGYGKLNVLKAAGYRGFSIIELERDTIDFGSAVQFHAKSDSVMIRNYGNDDLTVSSITTSSGIFGVNKTSMMIGPRSEGTLVVSVTPTDTGTFAGYVELASDDTSNPVVRITLLGRGDYAPVAGVLPDSIQVALYEGKDTTRVLTLSNAGNGPLSYEIGIDYLPDVLPGSRPPTNSTRSMWGHFSDELTVRSSAGSRTATTGLLPLIIKDPVGDAVDVDVSEIRGLTEGDHVTVQLVLASSFNPSNFGGYLGLDLDQNAATGLQLPAGLTGQNVGCEFFVSFFNLYSGVELYDSTGSYRGQFAAILDVPGKQFTFSIPLAILNNDNGTMNIAAVVGTYAAATDWVPDLGHGVLGISWITALPSSGIVPPISSLPVSVLLNAENLSGGNYSAKLIFVTNDPSRKTIDVPIKLSVAAGPNLAIADSINFGTVLVGFADTVVVEARNNGSGSLTVTSMTVDNNQFGILDATSYTLAKDQKRLVRIRCNPSGAGGLVAHLSVASNDPDMPLLSVRITAVAALPPVIALTPSDSLKATANEGDTTVQTLTISNTGAGELHWEVEGAVNTAAGGSAQNAVPRTLEEKTVIQQGAMQYVGKNSGTPSVGSYALNTLFSAGGTSHILLWTGFADTTSGGELENTMNAIRQFVPNASFERTATMSPSEFASRLAASDIFIMPEQERIYDLSALGATFAPALTSFVLSGKTMIVLDHIENGATTFLRGTGLLNITVLSAYEFTAVVHDSLSPLVKGVASTFYAMNGSNYHSSSNGKKIVRELYSGFNMVTERDTGAGRVIYIGMDFYSYNADMARLLANAVTSSMGSFVSTKPASGVVAPGASQDVAVTFDARNLHAGEYRNVVTIKNNDPLRNPKSLPVALIVIGQPVIRVKPDSIVGITAFVGVPRKDTLRVQNAGSELLSVTEITASDTSRFKTNKQSLYLLPGGEGEVVVTTTRSDTGSFRGQITFASNDAKTPNTIVVLAGNAIYPPVLTVVPDSIVITINEGDSTARTLTLGNTGLGQLQWEIPQFAESGSPASKIAAGGSALGTTDEKKYGVSDASLIQSGGKKWVVTQRDLNAGSAGTILIWSSIYNAPYWGTLTAMLESAGFTVVQTDIRPIQANNSYMAIFTSEPLTPLTPSEVSDLKNYVLSGGKVIDIGDSYTENINPFLIEFGVTRLYSMVSGPVSSTHKIFAGVGALTIDGDNWDNTLAVVSPSISIATCAGQTIASIGSNAGLLVFGEDSQFSDYVNALADPDNIQLLQNVIKWIKAGSWLTGYPNSGSLTTNGSQDVTVALNAKNLHGGDYRDLITLNNNDPLRNPKVVPVHLEVIGQPIIQLNPDSISGINAYAGVPRTDTLRVKNAGSDLLVINAVTSNDTTAFKPNVTNFYLLPSAEQLLAVTTTRSDTGLFRGQITIASNDAKRPSVAFILAGRAVYPAVLAIVPDSLAATVNEGDTLRRTLTISNSGLGELKWQLEGIAPASSLMMDQTRTVTTNVTRAVAKKMQQTTGMQTLWGKPSKPIPVSPPVASSSESGLATITLLPIIVKDPVDATGVDIAELRGSSGGTVTLQVVLASILQPNNFAGYLGLDLDQNAATGTTLPFGSSDQDVGCEFYLTFFDISAGVSLYDQFGNSWGQFPVMMDLPGNMFTFSVPLSILNNDDGVMNIAAVFGSSSGPTDWVPDAGHGVLQSWLFADLMEGVLPPGGSQNVAITLDARRLSGGDYQESFSVRNNDPIQGMKDVPISLKVTGTPIIQLRPDSIVAMTGYIGVPKKDTLYVANIGSALLAVSKVTSSDTSKFKIDTAAFNLGGGAMKKLVVTTALHQPGPFKGEISVTSNDAKRPTVTFVLGGTSVHPSVIEAAPDSFLVRLDRVDSMTRTLTINNNGLGNLEWEISGASSATSTISAELTRTDEERAAIQQRQAGSKGNNSGLPTVGSYSTKTLLSVSGTKRILLWTGFADTTEGGEVENTMNAIRQYSPDVSFKVTTTTSPSEFASLLNASDVFILPEQELTGNLTAVGSSLAPALTSFVQNGKTFIVLDFFWGYDSLSSSGSSSFLNATRLLDIRIMGYGSFFSAVVQDPLSPLVLNVPSPFNSMDGSNTHTSVNGQKIVREQYSGYNIVTQRNVGAGRVIYLGMDFYSYNRDMARLLSNAVNSSKGGFLFVSPGSGTILPGESQEVTVVFNKMGIPDGTYAASLLIYNNDPLRSPLVVPVRLESTTVGIEDVASELPKTFALHQNYPNPFNPNTTVAYDLPKASFVTLKIYNMVGQEVATLVEDVRQAGRYRGVWNAGGVASGIYFCRMSADSYTATMKLILIK